MPTNKREGDIKITIYIEIETAAYYEATLLLFHCVWIAAHTINNIKSILRQKKVKYQIIMSISKK